MLKSELLKLIEPGDLCLFDFKIGTYNNGWYEYIGLSPCESLCRYRRDHICPGHTKFKGLSSECLIFAGDMPVVKIDYKANRFNLPDELFNIEV